MLRPLCAKKNKEKFVSSFFDVEHECDILTNTLAGMLLDKRKALVQSENTSPEKTKAIYTDELHKLKYKSPYNKNNKYVISRSKELHSHINDLNN